MTGDYHDIHHYLVRQRGNAIHVGLHYVQVKPDQVDGRQDRFVAHVVKHAAQDLGLPVLQPGVVELTLV